MAVFWVVAPCSLVEVYQQFRGTFRFHHHGDDGGSTIISSITQMMETASTSEMSVNFYQTTPRYKP
jgi:hypothetical protein